MIIAMERTPQMGRHGRLIEMGIVPKAAVRMIGSAPPVRVLR